MKKRQKWNEAVSESIGFVLIFSLVLTGIGLVTMYGYPELLKNQINADERNMEQNLITLQNDIKLLSYSNIPYVGRAMRIAGGSLTVYGNDPPPSTDAPHFIIDYTKYNQSMDSCEATALSFYPGELRYDSEAGSAVISVENGAVLKRQELTRGSLMLAQPRWFVDEEAGKTFVIFLNGIQTGGKMLSSSGVANIRMKREIAEVIDENRCGTQTVKIEYIDPEPTQYDFETAWNTYFNGSYISEDLYPTGVDDEFALTNVDRIVIKKYNITVESI